MESDDASAVPVPRVNSEHLNRYVGSLVKFVGRVTEQRGTKVQLASSNGNTVVVNRNAQSAQIYSTSTFVEVFGQVNPDLSISEYAVLGFSAEFGK